MATVAQTNFINKKGPAKFWYQDNKTGDRFQLLIGDAFLQALAGFKSFTVRADPPDSSIHGGALSVQGEIANLRVSKA